MSDAGRDGAAGELEEANDALAAPARHLFLSPHFDDIALSCGGTAALLAGLGRRVEFAVVFGAGPAPGAILTTFALRMHESWGLEVTEAIAARRAEEEAAAAILGVRVSLLPFADAIYRGDHYTSDDVLFGPIPDAEIGLADEVIAALPPLGPDDRIYAPLAIGNHVDHQQIYRVGVHLARTGREVWFYEDMPYALRAGLAEARLAAVSERLAVAAVVDVAATWATKLAAILCYPSQLARIFGALAAGPSREEIDVVLRRYALAVGGDGRAAERFWRLR